jgi:hypothetical protein
MALNKPIPITTLKHYITGMTALNIPDPESTGGDWHFQEAFYGRGTLPPKIFLAGEGEEWNTNKVLADFGIHECSKVLRRLGLDIPANQLVYAANYLRAIIDMLYRCIKRKDYPYHLTIDEWLHSHNEKAQLITIIQGLQPYLEIDEWQIVQHWLASQT